MDSEDHSLHLPPLRTQSREVYPQGTELPRLHDVFPGYMAREQAADRRVDASYERSRSASFPRPEAPTEFTDSGHHQPHTASARHSLSMPSFHPLGSTSSHRSLQPSDSRSSSPSIGFRPSLYPILTQQLSYSALSSPPPGQMSGGSSSYPHSVPHYHHRFSAPPQISTSPTAFSPSLAYLDPSGAPLDRSGILHAGIDTNPALFAGSSSGLPTPAVGLRRGRGNNVYDAALAQAQFEAEIRPSSELNLHPSGSSSQHGHGPEMNEPEEDEDRPTRVDGERRHICPRCGRGFRRPSTLRTHGHSHTGFRPYICPYETCGRLFTVSSNMRRHLRGHFPPGTEGDQQLHSYMKVLVDEMEANEGLGGQSTD